MTPLRIFIFLVACCLIAQFHVFHFSAHAEGSIEESNDCTDVTVDYVDNPNLTREERIRLMDKAFYESLNRFERCQAAKDKASAATSGGNDGNEGIEGEAAQSSSAGSMASSTMSGTEPPPEYPPAEGFETLEPKPLQGPDDIDETASEANDNVVQANGKTPDDIPSAKNDDALAAQIRYAAEHEPDPEKRRQLWNEYRKYKGLATK